MIAMPLRSGNRASDRGTLRSLLRVPLIVAPMFKVSTPRLVSESCLAGAIGAFPSINARTPELFDRWLGRIEDALQQQAEQAISPLAVNMLTHESNLRFEPDLEVIVVRKPPIVIASVGRPERLLDEVHEYGGLVFADVVSLRHARRAADAGVDGLILLCAGAGGQTGRLSPFAFVEAVRQFFDGIVIVAGGITSGRHLRAVEAMGADLGYCGTNFLAAQENSATEAHKAGVLSASIDDIWDTDAFSGIPSSVLRSSLEGIGLAPENRWIQKNPGRYDWRTVKDRTDVLSAGHGAGAVTTIEPARSIIDRMASEYDAAVVCGELP